MPTLGFDPARLAPPPFFRAATDGRFPSRLRLLGATTGFLLPPATIGPPPGLVSALGPLIPRSLPFVFSLRRRQSKRFGRLIGPSQERFDWSNGHIQREGNTKWLTLASLNLSGLRHQRSASSRHQPPPELRMLMRHPPSCHLSQTRSLPCQRLELLHYLRSFCQPLRPPACPLSELPRAPTPFPCTMLS